MGKYAKIKALIESSYKFITDGSFRYVYDAEDYVIKIPRDRSGELDNYAEYVIYQQNKKSGRYAKCWIYSIENIPIIIMEKVRVIPLDLNNPCKKLPNWCSEIDCCQVGYDCNKNIVAYDYYDRMQENLHDGEPGFDLRLEDFQEKSSNYPIIPEPKVSKIMKDIKLLHQESNL